MATPLTIHLASQSAFVVLALGGIMAALCDSEFSRTLEMGNGAMILTELYYYAKPFLPRRLRLAVRRLYARKLLKQCGDTWPIKESAGQPPEGWPGWPED